MNERQPIHHSYVVPGIVDAEVMKAQAIRRRDNVGETTIVHEHRFKGDRGMILSCNRRCKVFEPGFRIRSVAEHPVMEDKDGND